MASEASRASVLSCAACHTDARSLIHQTYNTCSYCLQGHPPLLLLSADFAAVLTAFGISLLATCNLEVAYPRIDATFEHDLATESLRRALLGIWCVKA